MEFRRRWGFPVTLVTGVLSILVLGCVCSVSASEFVKVPSSVNCTVGQDCILHCAFNVTAGGGWGERSAVIWTRAETKYEVHVYINNRDQLEDQLPQYVNRTSLSDSELQRGDASLLLRRVTEMDAGKYHCNVYAPKQSGWGLIDVSASEFVKVPSSVNCTVGQDCILNCTFNYRAIGWNERSAVTWYQMGVNNPVHNYHDNEDHLHYQLPRYAGRTSLSDSEMQRGDASLLLRRVTEKDAGKYQCEVYAKQSGWGLIELVLVPAEPTTPPVPAEPTAPAVLEGQHHWFIVVPVVLCVISGLCVGLALCKKHADCCWKPSNALTASYSVTQTRSVRAQDSASIIL
ncbi:CD276 antigen-like [Acipenser oxyrinchus oxyrinchus]|uniref:CD276 antigen-like n=1 Tax=Acipenser oxyrinchus oxyrinchus TaxID=40147 RepID=A0AAD8CWP0_ACIOX|nr:CD276 antigen-like [Acipenser oxyrinchus oxyrinchus]